METNTDTYEIIRASDSISIFKYAGNLFGKIQYTTLPVISNSDYYIFQYRLAD